MKNKSFISLWTDRIDNMSSATTFAIFNFCTCYFYFWELCVPVILSCLGILFIAGLSYWVLLHIWQLKLNSSDEAVSRVFFFQPPFKFCWMRSILQHKHSFDKRYCSPSLHFFTLLGIKKIIFCVFSFYRSTPFLSPVENKDF